MQLDTHTANYNNYWLTKELQTYWAFTKGDLSAIVIPGLLFTLAGLLHIETTPLQFIVTLFLAGIYFWATLSFFCISNQIKGVSEDRINKPQRPIPSGLISIQESKKRYVIACIIAFALGVYLDIYYFTAIMYAATVLHNQAGGSKHWLYKDGLTGLGIFATISAGWCMVSPLNFEIGLWCVFLSLIWIVFSPIQDLRDVEGDKKEERKTFPIVFGVQFTKSFLAIGFIALPFIFHTLLSYYQSSSLFSWVWEIALGILVYTIAYKTYASKSSHEENIAYKLFTLYFCLMLTGSLFLF